MFRAGCSLAGEREVAGNLLDVGKDGVRLSLFESPLLSCVLLVQLCASQPQLRADVFFSRLAGFSICAYKNMFAGVIFRSTLNWRADKLNIIKRNLCEGKRRRSKTPHSQAHSKGWQF